MKNKARPQVTVTALKHQLLMKQADEIIRGIRVAAYVRVSTGHIEQENSYDAQLVYFKERISSNPAWKFAGIYADRGRSGTNCIKRPGFQQMLRDAEAGKFDLLLVKTVSRFARNTVDLLEAIRRLNGLDIKVLFEQQHLYAEGLSDEIILSILGALAQEESLSMSENIKWGIVRKMENGEFTLPYARFLGYRKGKNGKPEIAKKEARIVQRIYWLCQNGVSVNRIATILTNKRITAPGGGSRWHYSTVYSILSNEKYMGDALLQKTYTPDYLTHRSVKNNRKINAYHVRNSHEAIIDRETWYEVQRILASRSRRDNAPKSQQKNSKRPVCRRLL